MFTDTDMNMDYAMTAILPGYPIVKNLKARYIDKKEKENFADDTAGSIVGSLFSIFIGVAAVWLSWNCNVGVTTPLRVIYAIFAYIFGIIYIILYFILLRDKCDNK